MESRTVTSDSSFHKSTSSHTLLGCDQRKGDLNINIEMDLVQRKEIEIEIERKMEWRSSRD